MKHLRYKKSFVFLRHLSEVLLFLVLALLMSSCSDSTSSEGDEDGDLDMEDESEMSEVAGYAISLELTPPASSGYPAQQVIGLNVDEFEGSFTLRRAVNYSGQIVDPDGISTEAVINMVYSEKNGIIPGHGLSSLTVVSSEVGDGGEAVFSVDLLSGIYSRFVYPKNETVFPPLVLRDGLEIQDRLSETITFLRGYALGGTIFDHDQQPGVGLQVLAYESSDSIYRSNVVVTDAEGRFTDLRLPNFPGRYDVELSASEAQPLFPTTVLKELIWVGDSGILDPETAQLNIEIEKFIPDECTISGSVKGEDGQVIAGAVLIFSGVIGGGHFERQVTCDENGKYELSLLRVRPDHPEDTYSLTVLPPVESDYAILKSETIDCEAETHVYDFTLTRRSKLSGVVLSPDDEPLAGIEVQASKKATENETTVYVKSVVTDSEGAYRVRIDPGTYDISFIPPAGMNYARVSVYDIQLSTDGVLDQKLAQGRSFSGHVLDSDGLAAPSVYIEIYRIRPQKQSADLIGAGTTDTSGAFEIMLP